MIHKLNHRIIQLLYELQTYESICGTAKVGGQINVDKGSSLNSKKKNYGSGGKNGGKAQKSKPYPKEMKYKNKKKVSKMPREYVSIVTSKGTGNITAQNT